MIIVMSFGTFFILLLFFAGIKGVKDIDLKSPYLWSVIIVVVAIIAYLVSGLYELEQEEKRISALQG